MKPNFIVAGVAKCGTTSLFHYMNQHPEIDIPRKETFYFIRDFYRNQTDDVRGQRKLTQIVMTDEEYDTVYSKTKNKAVGEVSTFYFHLPDLAIAGIKNTLGDIPVIVILREPVERIWSAYKHAVQQRKETLSLEEALNSEGERKALHWDVRFYYKELSTYSLPAQKWKSEFKNTLFILNEELDQQPVKTMQKIFQFIGVDDQFIPDTKIRYNISDSQSNNIWFKAFLSKNIGKKIIKPVLNLFIKEESRRKIIHKLRKTNAANTPKLDAAFREQLSKLFVDDVVQLEKIISKDLIGWK